MPKGDYCRAVVRHHFSPSESHGRGSPAPSPLPLGKACFNLGYFQLKIVAGFRKMTFSHRKHEKESSWHLETWVKNSVCVKLGFYLMFLGKKPFSFLYSPSVLQRVQNQTK